ncbi:MAG: cytochrome c oxidase accessory protein CcoG [Hyphomicrobiaceae bacterium]
MTTVLDNRSGKTSAKAGKPLNGEPETHDVDAVNTAGKRQLYAGRDKIYPKLAHGRFRTFKWLVMAMTLAIYYGLPWLRWYRGPDLPDQAVLLDMPNNRYFFFFLEIWPQEFYYITGLLVIAALALFLATAVAGRVWCGYACPQTVWTDLMVTVERFWQGDRNARIRLDKEHWGPGKIFKKAMTHATWLLIGLLTGGALVFYFRDAPTLAVELASGTAPAIAYLFLGIFAFTTYLLGGIAREQVCIYMCPWPRIQGAMTDRYTLLVSYKPERGEPRGAMRKGKDGVVDWSTRGDCIACKACVAVCPTGIDIRDGSQLECIQCALCIDACNEIMDKIGRPRDLIAYDTVAKREATAKGEHEPHRFVRARTVLYAAVLALVASVMLVVWLNRATLEINVQRDRNPPFVRLSDGGIRNGYTVKILNKLHQPHTYRLRADGLVGATMRIVGFEDGAEPQITVPTDALRELRVFITVPPDALARLKSGSTDLSIVVRDIESRAETQRTTSFLKDGTGR